MKLIQIGLAALALTAASAGVSAQTGPQESDVPGVTTEIAYLRQYNGALHAGVLFRNTTDQEIDVRTALAFSRFTLVEGGKKYFPLKDPQGRYIAGPISDWNDGGRVFPHVPPKGGVLVWAVFEPVAATKLDVSLPLSQPFDAVPVTTTAPDPHKEVGAAVGSLRASLVSATRADGQLKVRIKIANPATATVNGGGIVYADAYVLDPASRKKYTIIKDQDGNLQAQPISDRNQGGRYFLTQVAARGQAFMALTFTAPPDTVKSVDIVVPELEPLENVALAGQGGSAETGQAVAGRTIGLQQALQDLRAVVTPKQVKVNLAADVLFDFDKADLKTEAEADLNKVVTVIKAYPGATVTVDGHTDSKGNTTYNQTLSEKRAAAVAHWLTTNAGLKPSQIRPRGWGKTKPIASNTKPDGTDNPEGRAKNRRVEITILRS